MPLAPHMHQARIPQRRLHSLPRMDRAHLSSAPPRPSRPQAKDTSHFKDKESGSDLEVQDKMPLLEWLANNYKKFGCTLEFVTNKSQEGSQFCRGFGGIGGILRYQVGRRGRKRWARREGSVGCGLLPCS